MGYRSFSPLATLRFTSSARVFSSSCCPDKDLIALIFRLGAHDRLSLWNYSHGSRVWEVEINHDNEKVAAEAVGLTWSPDGQCIAVIQNPPQLNIHSLEDGCLIRSLRVTVPPHSPSINLTGVWWYRQDEPAYTTRIPDIFNRRGVITGTSISILATLPLLDHLQDDPHKSTAADLFALQGSQPRMSHTSSCPGVIDAWPTLTIDPNLASIHSRARERPFKVSEDTAPSEVNDFLAVSDDLGNIHCFLDGSFPLGHIYLGHSVRSFHNVPKSSTFLAHTMKKANEAFYTSLKPLRVEVPLLEKRSVRDLAKLSSVARELVWYVMRVVQEMRTVWFGSDHAHGARHFGPKWVQALESRQKDYGESPDAILDLTVLLLTGRGSEALMDHLGSSETTSERSVQKWESTVSEALIKMRDYAEKRVIPACQRLHLILEELQAWSQLPAFKMFELSYESIELCLIVTTKIIFIGTLLGSIARRDLSQFRNFIAWLKTELSRTNPTGNANENPSQRYDILEANGYLMSALATNYIDNCFAASTESRFPEELAASKTSDNSVAHALEKARLALDADPALPEIVRDDVKDDFAEKFRADIQALTQELATVCGAVFEGAADAATHSAIISDSPVELSFTHGPQPPVIKDRNVKHEQDAILRYMLALLTVEQRFFLCITRVRYDVASHTLSEPGAILAECYFPESDGNVPTALHLLEGEFFDDESLVLVCRPQLRDSPTYIAMVRYADLVYQDVRHDNQPEMVACEDIFFTTVSRWKDGHFPLVQIPINRRRALSGCKVGGVSLALNGRQGRRVACVLDSRGEVIESFDLEAEDDEFEEIEEA